MKGIDRVYYINLERRSDRRQHIESEIARVGLTGERVDAIWDRNGALGCMQSHSKALAAFLASDAETALILEDDFTFVGSAAEIERLFSVAFEVMPADWDGLVLAYNPTAFSFCEGPAPFLVRLLGGQTTSGYLVRRSAAAELKSLWDDAAMKMWVEGLRHELCADICWQRLHREGKWYAFVPSMGYQYANHSDIQGHYAAHGC